MNKIIDFSIRLKELREEKNLTQKEFAKIFNIGIATIGMWESSQRKPPADMLIKIANFFNVTVDFLLGRTDMPTLDLSKTPDFPPTMDQFVEEMAKIGITEEMLAKMTDSERDTFFATIRTMAESFAKNKKG